MSSLAYMAWRKQRRARLQRLIDLRVMIDDELQLEPELGRQLEGMLVVQLAAEFQGFARSLHDLAIGILVERGSSGKPAVAASFDRALREGRKLGQGNATSAALGSDFRRIGLMLWSALKVRDEASTWQRDLDTLIRVRNVIAHSRDDELAKLAEESITIDIDAVNAWSMSLDALAKAMDDAVGVSLGTILEEPRPW